MQLNGYRGFFIYQVTSKFKGTSNSCWKCSYISCWKCSYKWNHTGREYQRQIHEEICGILGFKLSMALLLLGYNTERMCEE